MPDIQQSSDFGMGRGSSLDATISGLFRGRFSRGFLYGSRATPARAASFDGRQPTSVAEGVDRPCRAQVVTQTDSNRYRRPDPALGRPLACVSWTLKPWSSLRSKMDEAVLERGHVGPREICFDRREDLLRSGLRLLNFVSVGIAIALSGSGRSFAAEQLSGVPAWLRAHVGEGEGQIAPVVLERARALYLQKVREGAVRNPCYFAMDATRPHDLGGGRLGRRFYVICEADRSYRAVSVGHGGGRDLANAPPQSTRSRALQHAPRAEFISAPKPLSPARI